MKIKKLFYVMFPITLTCFVSQAHVENNQKPTQKLVVSVDEFLDEDFRPTELSGLKTFFTHRSQPTLLMKARQPGQTSKTAIFNQTFMKYIKKIYNEHRYAETLSQNAQHVIDFLELSNEYNLSTEMVYVGIRLFYNKIKSCEIIDDTVINQLLGPLPTLIERHFQETAKSPVLSLTDIKKNVEYLMLTRFTDHFSDFQKKPDHFLSSLSDELVTTIGQNVSNISNRFEKEEARNRLRMISIRFFDTALGKVMWNPKSPQGIWQSFLTIANNLQRLGTHGIIAHMDDLDDLLWSLVHRFNYFLDVTGSALPLGVYDEIEHDIVNRLVFFLETKEQDDGIKTKKETIVDALIQAKTKAIAFQNNGIVSQPF